MTPAEVLEQTKQILASRSGGGLALRIAAFMIRQALEDIVAKRCVTLKAPAPSATMRSRLLVLRALDDPVAADRAAVAWNRLSSACHVHAYEMQPSLEEIKHLCESVAALLPTEPSQGSAGN